MGSMLLSACRNSGNKPRLCGAKLRSRACSTRRSVPWALVPALPFLSLCFCLRFEPQAPDSAGLAVLPRPLQNEITAPTTTTAAPACESVGRGLLG